MRLFRARGPTAHPVRGPLRKIPPNKEGRPAKNHCATCTGCQTPKVQTRAATDSKPAGGMAPRARRSAARALPFRYPLAHAMFPSGWRSRPPSAASGCRGGAAARFIARGVHVRVCSAQVLSRPRSFAQGQGQQYFDWQRSLLSGPRRSMARPRYAPHTCATPPFCQPLGPSFPPPQRPPQGSKTLRDACPASPHIPTPAPRSQADGGRGKRA